MLPPPGRVARQSCHATKRVWQMAGMWLAWLKNEKVRLSAVPQCRARPHRVVRVRQNTGFMGVETARWVCFRPGNVALVSDRAMAVRPQSKKLHNVALIAWLRPPLGGLCRSLASGWNAGGGTPCGPPARHARLTAPSFFRSSILDPWNRPWIRPLRASPLIPLANPDEMHRPDHSRDSLSGRISMAPVQLPRGRRSDSPFPMAREKTATRVWPVSL